MTVLPIVSIVIPTHDRRHSLERSFHALARQTCDPSIFEVILAANACTDDTVAWARGITMPFRLRILDLPAAGAAAARNAGAEVSRGALVTFLDDDIEVEPGFVAAHLEAHGMDHGLPSSSPGLRVAIGYLPAALQPEADFFAVAVRGWWEAMFDRMREPGHCSEYVDLLSGNCSLPRQEFLRLGGFDTTYRCHEDYELGYRLIKAGATFVFAERASGSHADFTRLGRACWRKREEGRADVQLASQYPELRAALPLTRRTSAKQRVLRLLAFHAPRVGETLVAMLGRTLPVLERVRARSTWLRMVYAMFDYWYERGVADAIGSHSGLRSLLADAWTDSRLRDPGLVLDVDSVEAAEQRLDRERPHAATLRVAGREFAHIPYRPGTERLAGRHLRPALVQTWHRAYVRALVAANRIAMLSGDSAAGSTGAPERSDDPARDLLPQSAPPSHSSR